MYISCVYLSTFAQTTPITGHFEIKSASLQTKVEFSADEAAAIQELCAKALDRFRAAAAQELLSASITVPQLEAPKPEIEEGDFEEVSE